MHNHRLEWNPDLKADCDYPIAGYWVCVGIKRPALTIIYPTTNDTVPDPTPWTPRPTPTETSVYPPTKTQPGLAPSCSAFYEAQPVSPILPTQTYIHTNTNQQNTSPTPATKSSPATPC